MRRLWRHVTHGLRVLTRRERADLDLDDEVRHYVEEATEAGVARGLTPAAARRQALAEVGSAVRLRERVRDHGWEQGVASWITDLRLAARALRKTPVFTAVVVLVVALGSGAVATVFSAMNAIVLRPIAGVRDPSTLVSLQPARRDGGTAEQVSYARYDYLRARAHGVDGIAAWGRVTFTIAGDGPGVTVLGNLVTAGYFDVLGLRPARGRFFAPGEADTPGGQPVLVVSDAFWRTRLGADPAAVGRTLTVNGHPYTLVGVAPSAFRGLYTGLVIDAWAPVTMQPQLRPRSNLTGATWLWAFARVRGGIEPAALERELSALVRDHRRDTGAPDASSASPDAETSMRVTPLTGLPGGSRDMLGFLGVLLAAALLVLVIAGVNVAALLSGRYVVRGRDLAVRAALGAGRARLIRLLLTEVGLLFVLGAAGGFAVASVATSALERLPLPGTIPVTLEISPDLRVLAFAVLVALASGIVFGLAPALQGAKKDIVARLRVETPGAGVRRSWTGRVLVAGQLALSLVLLVAAGLFARAVDRGARVDPGFDVRGVTTVAFEPEAWGYDAARSTAFYQSLRERLAAEPGVTAVSYAQRLPLMFSRSTDTITLAGATRSIDYTAIDPGYFDALKQPLLRGRPVLPSDVASAPRVAVVNETLARAIAPDGAAVGATFRFRDAETTVVGVARDAKYAALDETTPLFVYVPLSQVEQPRRALLVRAEGAGADAAIVRAVAAIDPAIPPPQVSTLARDAQIALLPQRAAAIVTGALGAVGLVLAALGLYGTLAASAARRVREVGIRLALGASRGQVVRQIAGEGIRLAAVGAAAGLLLSALAMPLARRWLFQVSPLDALTYAGMAAVFGLVAVLASYLPARRAAAADPLRSLRTD